METVVVKVGGSTLEKVPHLFYEELVSAFHEGLIRPILVHGGGPAISDVLQKFQIPTRFVRGLRYTDEETVQVVEMVLSGMINKRIVREIVAAKGRAVGISGLDGNLFTASLLPNSDQVGLVGKVSSVNRELLTLLLDQGIIPVVSPVSMDAEGRLLNVNADQAAASIAESFGSSLLFLSDIPGIMVREGDGKKILRETNPAEIDRYIIEGEITGGMIPKVESALSALSHGAKEVMIIDGNRPGLLRFLLDGVPVGTRIQKEERNRVSANHGNL